MVSQQQPNSPTRLEKKNTFPWLVLMFIPHQYYTFVGFFVVLSQSPNIFLWESPSVFILTKKQYEAMETWYL